MTILRKRNIFRGNFPRKQEFLEGVQDCLAHARAMYPDFDLHLCDIPIVFTPNGHRAGSARWRNATKSDDSPVTVWNLEFSVEAISVDWEKLYLDTIPHEVAHIVTRFLYGAKEGSSHGRLWVSVAKSLGCTGKRCHSMRLTAARKTSRKHLYISDGGTECLVGPIQHKKLQSGQYRSFTITATKENLYPHNHVRAA